MILKSLTSVVLAAGLLAGVSVPAAAQSTATDAPPPLQALDFGPFEADLAALTDQRRDELDVLVIEATIRELQSAMESGTLTSLELTSYYLDRIRRHDVDGLRSMLELNPEALAIAADLDAERAAGNVRGPLHGIPVSLKGNIGTADLMHTSAGAVALAENISDRDAGVATRLRDAGAVLIGKANLSEWAGWIYPALETAGFSALGGFPVNPFDPALPVLGSSSGSAVGTSANLVAASVGTETAGSLIAPASANGVVGMHPSLGLVSRDRVIPLTSQTDTPGPVARSVADAATMLTAIAGVDEQDPATEDAAALDGVDFTSYLDTSALEGVRVGVALPFDDPGSDLLAEELSDFYEIIGAGPAVAGLEAAGAEVVPVFGGAFSQERFRELIDNGLRLEFAEYIGEVDPDGPITSIADVVAFNAEDLDVRAPFGQGFLPDAAATALTPEEYDALGDELRAEARAYIDGLLVDADVDILASRANLFSNAYAVAGYPAITVPDGPLSDFSGLTLIGPYLSDDELIGYAFAFEQATKVRTSPPQGD